ncbi:MAG: hypothetical protein AAF745_17660 [Planctomycetota bacterium]
MNVIRDFCNRDLPALTRVWSEHWTAAGSPPPVSSTVLERAILSRSFFKPDQLMVAIIDDQVEAWCHFGRPVMAIGDLDGDASEPESGRQAVLSAFCFTAAGLQCCDELLAAVLARMTEFGCENVVVGPLRDQHCGYVGLPPIGHGMGVPDMDVRASSLLSRNGFSPVGSFEKMATRTAPYQPPVSREMMQLRRTTRAEKSFVLPQQGRYAAAMSHIDIEHHQLINHCNGQRLANMRLWLSDPESQVMSCSEAILDLSPIEAAGQLTSAESFLIVTLIQTLATRCIFDIETTINSEWSALKEQLVALHFANVGGGARWTKTLV